MFTISCGKDQFSTETTAAENKLEFDLHVKMHLNILNKNLIQEHMKIQPTLELFVAKMLNLSIAHMESN